MYLVESFSHEYYKYYTFPGKIGIGAGTDYLQRYTL
jgi:hypothetical protein